MVSITLWGVVLGGIVYSHVVYFPVYLSDLPASAVLVTGAYALDEGRFWMAIHPLLLLSLIVNLVVNLKVGAVRNRILISFGIYIAVIVVTQLYFLPELMAFARSASSDVSPAEWLARGNRWQYLSWIRGGVMFAAFFVLLSSLLAERKSYAFPTGQI